MQRYEHGGDIYADKSIALDFSVNINPLGMPEAVQQAIIDHIPQYVRYPDPACRALRAALAARHGIEEEMILCGNGASELILALCSALRPRRAVIAAPTFSEYERVVILFGGEVYEHQLLESQGFALTESILTKLTPDVDMVFLCNPNNPTGQLIDPALLCSIAEVCSENQTLLILDECFIDFTCGKSMLSQLKKYPNLLILRAFTKIYAMAGLRLGALYSADERLLSKTAMHMPTWSVSSVAQAAGIAALGEPNWVESTRQSIEDERGFMTSALRRLGLTVYQSDADFLLIKSEQMLHAPLRARGILVRSCANFTGLNERYIRIGLKTHKENMTLLRAVSEVLNG